MKYIIFSIIFFNILFYSIAFSQSSYLAKIGDEIITLDEFKERYELTPKIKSDYKYDSTKIQFLYSMIAEELWALEAESLSLDTVAYVHNSTKNIERKLVKDKLYKTDIEEKVEVTDNEILKNLPKLKEKRVMNFIYSESKEEINRLYQKLKLGLSFDSLLSKRPENKEQTNGITTTYGEMDEEIEDKIFHLKINQFTEPIQLKHGWGIYYLKKIELNLAENRDDRKRVKEILSTRKAKKLYSSFFTKYINGRVINTDKELFVQLRNEIYKLLTNGDENMFFNENEKTYQLGEYQIKKIATHFSDEELARSFIKFEISPISLKRYLLNLELNDFKCQKLSLEGVTSALRKDIKAYIFEELLVREGYSRSLQNYEGIKKELKIWKRSFLSSYYRHLYLDSVMVSNKDAKRLYNKIILENGNPTEKSFNDVKNLIKKGLYFNELEELYTNKTISLAEKYGFEIDYKKLTSLNVTEVEMLVYRVLGFGGKITAVPYLQPFYKWKNWLPKPIKKSYKD